MGSRWMRNSFVYLLILVAVIAIVVAFFRPSSGGNSRRDLSTVIADAKSGAVKKIEVKGTPSRSRRTTTRSTARARKREPASSRR